AVTLTGGDGDDFLRGRQYGKDLLDGGAGNDIISGGLAKDITADISAAVTAGTAQLAALVEAAATESVGDIFDGDTLTGGAGKDVFIIAGTTETGIYANQLGTINQAQAISIFGTDAATEEFAQKGFVDIDGGGTTGGLAYSGIYGVDTITDFTSGEDRIAIFQEASFGFTGLGAPGVGNLGSFQQISFGTLVGVADEKQLGVFAPGTTVGHVLFDSASGGVYIGDGDKAVLVSVLNGVTSIGANDVLFTTKAALDAGITFF
ncbi:MAG: hypothetical protein WA882_11505, partial [Geitlerinemataceae cyanobacterium]